MAVRASDTALQSLRDLVERNARLHGDDAHLVYEGCRRTFSEFAARVKRLAAAMEAWKLLSQDRISILAMNCAEYLEVYGIAEVSSYIVAPVNFRLAAPEIAWILRDASPRVLFVESQYCALIDGLRSQLPSIEHYVCIGEICPAWARPYEEVLTGGTEDICG